MPEINVQWPEKDLQEMAKQITRGRDDLGRDVQGLITQAGYFLARSASARTKTAPKTRRALKTRKNQEQKVFGPFYRVVWRAKKPKGPDAVFLWGVQSKTDNKYRDIPGAGLAKQSWKWMIPGIRNQRVKNFAVEAYTKSSGLTYEVHMMNRLHYIREALKTDKDGSLLLNEAMGKAASQMRKAMDRRSAQIARRK